MSIDETKTVKRSVVFLILANFLTFIIYYISFYVIKNQATIYIFYYLTEIANSFLPVLAAALLFVLSRKCGRNKCFLYALYYSFAWAVNLFPYYAFEYAYQGIEINAVLTYTTIHTLFMVIVTYIEITVLFLLMIFATEKFARKSGFENHSTDGLKIPPFDFSNSRTLGVFSASAAVFVYNLISEITDTVSYIRDVDGFYESGEIVYIIFRYLFILLMLIGCHFLSIYATNKLTSVEKS